MPEPRFICNMYGRNISYTHKFDQETKEETTYRTQMYEILREMGCKGVN